MITSSFHLYFPHFTIYLILFHSFHWLMNSINWRMGLHSSAGEHCRANAEATGSNPAEAPKNCFFRASSQLLKLRFNCDGHIFISFHFISAVHIISFIIPLVSGDNFYATGPDLSPLLKKTTRKICAGVFKYVDNP